MKCYLCGTEIESGAKFCPNCGAEVTEPATSDTSNHLDETPVSSIDDAPAQPEEFAAASDAGENLSEQPVPTQPEAPVNPYAGALQQNTADTANANASGIPNAVPYQNGNPYAGAAPQNPYPNSNPNPIPNQNPYVGVPQYSAVPPQYAGAGVPLKKKKKVWPWVLTICLCVFVVIAAVIVIIAVFIGKYVSKDLEICNAAQECAYAVVYADGDKFCDQLPEEFLAYLESEYEIDRDGLEDQLDDYLGCDRVYSDAESKPASNGMEWISDYWTTDDVFYSHEITHDIPGIGDITSACEDAMAKYGIRAEEFSLVSLDEDDTEESLCAVKIGDDWYIIDSMMLADELCSLAYGKNSDMRTQAADYLNAVASRDADAIQAMVPEEFWTYLEHTYDCDSSKANEKMQDYLEDTFGVGTISSFSCETEDPVWYYRDNIKDFNKEYAYGLEYDYCVDISCSFKLTDEVGAKEDDYTVTFVEIDGEWYLADAMIDFDYACYLDSYGYYDYDNDDDWDYDSDDFFHEDGSEPLNGTINLPDPNCEKIMDDYFAAISHTSAVEMSALVPDPFWSMVSSYSGMSKSEAEGCMTFYLLDLQASFDKKGVQYDYIVTATDDYSASECLEMNEYLEPYELDGESYTDVWMDLTVTDSSGEEIDTDEIYLTFTKIDGTWYLYDAMYDYLEACDFYEGTAGSDM